MYVYVLMSPQPPSRFLSQLEKDSSDFLQSVTGNENSLEEQARIFWTKHLESRVNSQHPNEVS